VNRLDYGERALLDLERLTDFLVEKDPDAARATVGIILSALDVLRHSPEIGRKVRGGNRELVISRGATGYLALYHFFAQHSRVLVLAVRHQREAGYAGQ